MVKITVNGEVQEVNLPLTVEELVKNNNVAQPDTVSVQVNDDFLGRNEYATRRLEDGGVVEFLYFMGGGQAYV